MLHNGISKVWVFAIFWMALLLLVGPLVHVLKVARLDFSVGAVLFYVSLPSTVFLLASGSLFQRTPPRLFLLEFFILFALLVLVSVFTTAINGGMFEDIAGNGLRLAFVILTVLSLGGWGIEYRAIVMKWLPKFAFAALAVSLGSVGLIYLASFAGFGVYFGLQVAPAMVSLAYGLVSRRHAYTVLSVLALFGAGKRGGMLAAASIILGYVAIALGKIQVHRLFAFLATGLFVVVFAFAFGFVPEAVMARLDFLLDLDQVDLNVATSGRVYEIEAAFSILDRNPSVWFVGQGLGSTIDAYHTTMSTVHFTPIGLLLIFGLPLTILIYGALIAFLLLVFGYVRGPRSRGEDAIFFLVILGELAFTFTAFTILQSFQLWMAIIFVAVGMQQARSAGAYSYPVVRRPAYPGV